MIASLNSSFGAVCNTKLKSGEVWVVATPYQGEKVIAYLHPEAAYIFASQGINAIARQRKLCGFPLGETMDLHLLELSAFRLLMTSHCCADLLAAAAEFADV